MTQFSNDPQDTEAVSRSSTDRFLELADQNWTRDKSHARAAKEDINFSDEHWAVILFLRKRYLVHGVPSHARDTANELIQQFYFQGGNQYLYRLFPGGPVSQGSRIANLPIPASASSSSFGAWY